MHAIKSIVQTEKTSLLPAGYYCLIVSKDSSKLTLKSYLEKRFNVKVESVNTLNYYAEKRSFKGKTGHLSAYKKAIIKLKPGYTIPDFESKDNNVVK